MTILTPHISHPSPSCRSSPYAKSSRAKHPLAQGDLPKESGILRTAVQLNQGHVGVYAAVVQGGTIRRGDRVRVGESG